MMFGNWANDNMGTSCGVLRILILSLVLNLISGVIFNGTVAKAQSAQLAGFPKAPETVEYHPTTGSRVKLGQLLFYDKILSGNRNIACATCHHHNQASADGLSLPVGEGGVGVGPKRTVGAGIHLIEQRVPRNSPALFNLGAKEFTTLFTDGRVSLDPTDGTGFNTPAEEDLPPGLETVMAAQALFPVTSAVEMAGEFGENDVANAANRGVEYVWPLLAKRLRGIAEYITLFRKAFPDIKTPSEITMVHAANALAEFQMSEWRSDQSPFDHFLRGDKEALTAGEKRGLDLFYGDAGCSQCHSGVFQTDHKFYAIVMPQIGFPLTRRFDPVVRDRGRLNETDQRADQYRFRTPSLRNVTETAPYGHSGAFRTLEAVVRHHLDPVKSYENYDRGQVILPPHPRLDQLDFMAMDNHREAKSLINANELTVRLLSDAQIDDLLRFLKTLTDKKSLMGKLGIPRSVPSGLKVD